jgi:hypothetical protein
MSYDTKVLLVLLVTITVMFGSAALYAYFKMEDTDNKENH